MYNYKQTEKEIQKIKKVNNSTKKERLDKLKERESRRDLLTDDTYDEEC